MNSSQHVSYRKKKKEESEGKNESGEGRSIKRRVLKKMPERKQPSNWRKLGKETSDISVGGETRNRQADKVPKKISKQRKERQAMKQVSVEWRFLFPRWSRESRKTTLLFSPCTLMIFCITFPLAWLPYQHLNMIKRPFVIRSRGNWRLWNKWPDPLVALKLILL